MRQHVVDDHPRAQSRAGQVEVGQHGFEPVDQFGTTLKPRIAGTFVEKGLALGTLAQPLSIFNPAKNP
jgi:hypothetical protein